jgi:hypothetical protein
MYKQDILIFEALVMPIIGSVSDYIILVLHLTVFLQVIGKQAVGKFIFVLNFILFLLMLHTL